MYKDLSLKEKAKVLLYGGKLGLTSVEDIAKLYDDAISHKFAEGSTATPDWDPINKVKLKYIQKKVLSAIDLFGIEEVRQRAYNNIDPWGIYLNARSEFNRGIIKNQKPNYPMSYEKPDEWKLRKGRERISDAIFAQYLQIPTQQRHFDYLLEQSSYKPTVGGNENDIYYKLPLDDETKQFLIDERFAPIYEYNSTVLDKDNRGEKEIGRKNIKIGQNTISTILGGYNLGTHTIGRGYDKDKGEYVSYYDLWDLNPIKIEGGEDLSQGIGTPVKIYDRIYLDDYYGIGDKGGHATWLPEVTITPNEYAKGGPIISPYGLWKYPGRDIIIPSNNITMDNVNYPVLGVSDTGDTKVMMPWNDYKFRGSVVYEHPLINNQFQLGGNTKPTFDLWYPTVPNQKNDTSSYDLRRAYNTLPFDEMEKFRTIDDYHLPSVAYDEKTDTYTFLKRNGHPTLNYELDWYNSGSPDALEFRERYKLDTLSLPWRYIPRTYLEGGNTLEYLNVPEYNIALYNTVSPLGDFPNFWGALAYRRLVKDKLKNGNIYERDYKVGDTQGEKTAMAAWAKRLGIPYNELDLPVYNGDTVTLPNSLVLEIPYDTNMLKTRIQLNKALLDKYSKYRYSDVVDAAIKADLYNLDKLRETYKTGKPVGLTEFGWNSRLLVNNGEIIPIENIQSPLNVLGNYNVRYSPEERRLYYSDEYDFNQFENFVPGEPYRIRGYIDLDNNKALEGNLFKKGGIYINPKNKGKFNATKKRTGKTTEELTHSKNPLTRKRAIFAQNAKRWNHKRDEGGYLYSEGGFLLAPYLYVE